MSANLKRLEKIEAALEQLLAKEKAYLLFYRGNDPEAELQWHIDAGNYDPATQEAVIIMAWGRVRVPILRLIARAGRRSCQPLPSAVWPTRSLTRSTRHRSSTDLTLLANEALPLLASSSPYHDLLAFQLVMATASWYVNKL